MAIDWDHILLLPKCRNRPALSERPNHWHKACLRLLSARWVVRAEQYTDRGSQIVQKKTKVKQATRLEDWEKEGGHQGNSAALLQVSLGAICQELYPVAGCQESHVMYRNQLHIPGLLPRKTIALGHMCSKSVLNLSQVSACGGRSRTEALRAQSFSHSSSTRLFQALALK